MNPSSTLGNSLPAALVAVLLGVLPACRGEPGPGAADASAGSPQAPSSGAVAPAESADTGNANPPTGSPGAAPARRLAPSVRAVVGSEIRPLSVAGPNDDVEPQSRFELELPPMAEVRVRLFDSADKAVPSTDRMETGTVTRYVLTPSPALAPASRYTLVIDGLRAPESIDKVGNRYEPLRIELKTGGEPVKPTKPAKKRRR